MTPQDVITGCLDDGQLTVLPNGDIIRNKNGKKIGCVAVKGYIVCSLTFKKIKKQVKAHQVVWIALRGQITKGLVIDHINRVATDNRIENLRMVTPFENAVNKSSRPASLLTKSQPL